MVYIGCLRTHFKDTAAHKTNEKNEKKYMYIFYNLM